MNNHQQRLDRVAERLDYDNVLSWLTDEELAGVRGLVSQRCGELPDEDAGPVDMHEISGQQLWAVILPFLEEWRAMAQADKPS